MTICKSFRAFFGEFMKISTLVLSFGVFFAAASVRADTITLVADVWCPYNCGTKDSNPGILIEVAKYALGKAGHSVEYTNVPWARAIEDSRVGKYSGIVGAYKEDAPDFVFPEKGIMPSSNDFFVKAGSTWKFESIASLASVSLGTIHEYSYGDEIDKYIEANHKDPTKIQMGAGDDALAKNIEKLLAGRIGAMIEDAAVMSYQLKQSGKTGQIVKAGTFGGDDVHVAFSPKNPNSQAYAKLMTDGLNELVINGEFEKIKAKYQ